MCLIINYNASIEIAKKDIPVWKSLRRCKGRTLAGISPVYDTRYIKNSTKRVKCFSTFRKWDTIEFSNSIPTNTKSIEKGLHSYRIKPKGLRDNEHTKLVRCFIPKGTPFIRSCNNLELVSLALRITE